MVVKQELPSEHRGTRSTNEKMESTWVFRGVLSTWLLDEDSLVYHDMSNGIVASLSPTKKRPRRQESSPNAELGT